MINKRTTLYRDNHFYKVTPNDNVTIELQHGGRRAHNLVKKSYKHRGNLGKSFGLLFSNLSSIGAVRCSTLGKLLRRLYDVYFLGLTWYKLSL